MIDLSAFDADSMTLVGIFSQIEEGTIDTFYIFDVSDKLITLQRHNDVNGEKDVYEDWFSIETLKSDVTPLISVNKEYCFRGPIECKVVERQEDSIRCEQLEITSQKMIFNPIVGLPGIASITEEKLNKKLEQLSI